MKSGVMMEVTNQELVLDKSKPAYVVKVAEPVYNAYTKDADKIGTLTFEKEPVSIEGVNYLMGTEPPRTIVMNDGRFYVRVDVVEDMLKELYN